MTIGRENSDQSVTVPRDEQAVDVLEGVPWFINVAGDSMTLFETSARGNDSPSVFTDSRRETVQKEMNLMFISHESDFSP